VGSKSVVRHTLLQQSVRQSFEEREKTQKETLAAPSVSACDEAAKAVVRRFLSCQLLWTSIQAKPAFIGR
jgi:hypothetical protein